MLDSFSTNAFFVGLAATTLEVPSQILHEPLEGTRLSALKRAAAGPVQHNTFI